MLTSIEKVLIKNEKYRKILYDELKDDNWYIANRNVNRSLEKVSIHMWRSDVNRKVIPPIEFSIEDGNLVTDSSGGYTEGYVDEAFNVLEKLLTENVEIYGE